MAQKSDEVRKKRVELARKFIQGAAWNMVMNLNYYNRRGKDLQNIIDTIKRLSNTLPDAKAVDEIMGIEGNIRQAYPDFVNAPPKLKLVF